MRGRNQTLCAPPVPAANGSAAFDSASAFKQELSSPHAIHLEKSKRIWGDAEEATCVQGKEHVRALGEELVSLEPIQQEQKSFVQDDPHLSPALAGLLLPLLPGAHMGSGESEVQMALALQRAHFSWLGER